MSECREALPLPNPIIKQLYELASSRSTNWSYIGKVAGGLSASRVYQIRIGEDCFALRDWQWALERSDRLKEVLAFQDLLHRHWDQSFRPNARLRIDKLFGETVNPIPSLSSWWAGDSSISAKITCDSNSMWTLSSWRPGQAYDPADSIISAQLDSLASTLARLHAISISTNFSPSKSVGWNQRNVGLQKAFQASRMNWLPVQQMIAEKNRDRSATELSLTLELSQLLDPAKNQPWLRETLQLVQLASNNSYWSCWIVGDLHLENFLFQSTQVTGIVDFGAARIDWPWWDIVRLVSSFPAGAEAISDCLVNSYIDCLCRIDLGPNYQSGIDSYLASIEAWRSMHSFQALTALQTFLSLRNWLDWLIEGSIKPAAIPRIRWLIDRWKLAVQPDQC